jgi:REP element-mobilizing transposase RayT
VEKDSVGAGDSPAPCEQATFVPLILQNEGARSPLPTLKPAFAWVGRPRPHKSPPKTCRALVSDKVQRRYEYRRNLPHYQKDNRIMFFTYCTWHRWKLPEPAMDLALESCLRANGRKCRLYAAVAMPDHVHLLCMALMDENGSISIPEITRTIKSESAHRINKALGRSGRVWQDESFDHVLRGDESLRKKVYISWRIRCERDLLGLSGSTGGCGGMRN